MLVLLLVYRLATASALVLSEDVELSWEPLEDGISFTLTAATRGYIGLGITSPSTTDIIMMWVDDGGRTHLRDCHAESWKGLYPIEDKDQNYKIISGFQNTTHTSVSFFRHYNTCDPQDVPITRDTMKIMWSHGVQDPVTKRILRFHDLEWHGVRSVHLASLHHLPPHHRHKYWDVTSNHVLIPENQESFYWCKIFRVPALDKKHHIIGYSPLIEKEHLVERIVLYECLGNRVTFERFAVNHRGGQCQSAPPEWKACATPVATWAAGSQGEMYPDHVGLPMSEGEGKSTYFLLKIHYENSKLLNVGDSSGLRIYYTDELRPFDGGIFVTGVAVSPLHVVPPYQKSFKTSALCDNQCTNLMLPESGISVVSVSFHSHAAGRKMKLRHVRESKELPPIFQDNEFDHRFQQAHKLVEEVKILPGDDLITECIYDSANRTKLTLGGYTAHNERCSSHILYYPRIALSSCSSMIPAEFFFHSFGVKEFYKHDISSIEKMLLAESQKQLEQSASSSMAHLLFHVSKTGRLQLDANRTTIFLNSDPNKNSLFSNLMIYKPDEFHNKSFLSHLSQLPWKEFIFTQRVEEMLNFGLFKTFCKLQDDSLAMPSGIYAFPNFTTYNDSDTKLVCRSTIYHQDDFSNGIKNVSPSYIIVILVLILLSL